MSFSTWSTLIHQAEKLVGGPAPFINLSSLLTSEAGFLTSRARRVAANVDHPLFSTIRTCFNGRPMKSMFLMSRTFSGVKEERKASKRPSGGLIILLFGQSHIHSEFSLPKVSSQHRSLAEMFETVHMAMAIHKSLVNLPNSDSDQTDEWTKNMEMGNKLAILAGDVLLASVSSDLAKFHHPRIVDIVSESIGNMVEAEFDPLAVETNSQFNAFSTAQQTPTLCVDCDLPPVQKWLSYVTLSRGSLLANCCQASILLVEADLAKQSLQPPASTVESLLVSAKQFAMNWACLLRLLEEIEHLQQTKWFNDQNTNMHYWFQNQSDIVSASLPSISPYRECGILEPTLAYACLLKPYFDKSTTVDYDFLINTYKEVGVKLSDQMHRSLDRLALDVHTHTKNTGINAVYLPTLALLRTISDKLTDDLKIICN